MPPGPEALQIVPWIDDKLEIKIQDLSSLVHVSSSPWADSVLWPHLDRVLSLAVQDFEASSDHDTVKLAKFYIDEPCVTIGSMKAISDTIGINTRNLQPDLVLFANTLLHLDRSMRRRFEKVLAQDPYWEHSNISSPLTLANPL